MKNEQSLGFTLWYNQVVRTNIMCYILHKCIYLIAGATRLQLKMYLVFKVHFSLGLKHPLQNWHLCHPLVNHLLNKMYNFSRCGNKVLTSSLIFKTCIHKIRIGKTVSYGYYYNTDFFFGKNIYQSFQNLDGFSMPRVRRV